jgi:SAM-dependent methyltransferase
VPGFLTGDRLVQYPKRSMVAEIYDDGSYLADNPTWHAEDADWKAQQCLALLTDLGIKPATLCDVGCGTGDVLAVLRRYYPAAEMRGFDISSYAISVARKNHPDIVFQQGDVSGRYDLMLVLDVLEHIEDCFGFARSLKQHAEHVIFHIPLELSCLSLWRDVPSAHRRALGHVHFFTAMTALALLRDCGFEIISYRYTPAGVDRRVTAGVKAGLLRRARLLVLRRTRRLGFRTNPDKALTLIGGYALLVAVREARASDLR